MSTTATPASSTFTGPTNVTQRRPTRPTRRTAPEPGRRRSTRWPTSMHDAEPVPQLRRHRVAVGQPHRPHAAATSPIGHPLGAAQRHRRHDRDDAGAAADLRQRRRRRLHRWMRSLAVDRNGNMALGYSVVELDLHPAIRYAGRLAGDPLNTLPPDRDDALRRVGGSQTRHQPLGRLQRDDRRPRRLHVLVHDRVLRGQRERTGRPASAPSSSPGARPPPRKATCASPPTLRSPRRSRSTA